MRKYQVRFRGGITEKELSYLAGILPDLWEIFDISPADLGFKNYEFVVDWSEVKE